MFKLFATALVSTLCQAVSDDEWVYRYEWRAYESWRAEYKFNRLVGELESDTTGADIQYSHIDDLFK